MALDPEKTIPIPINVIYETQPEKTIPIPINVIYETQPEKTIPVNVIVKTQTPETIVVKTLEVPQSTPMKRT